MTVHRVRSWAHFYDAIAEGDKTHDLRKNDRDYRVGDILELVRFDNVRGIETGEEQKAVVTYVTDRNCPCAFSSAVLPHDYAILSIRKVK